MPIIDLNTAVREIYQIVDQRRRRDANLRSPFFFIVGSGVSVPFIPLASEIEEQCRLEAQRYDATTPPQPKPGMESYSHWLRKAYPSPEELQTYLRGLMEDKPISKANLRLAHLLLDGTIARTVFTPNFDDMAIKALELFGKRPLVCDHPLTVGRIRIESEDIQVVHVHGSYWFYDCCNLSQEIADRSGYGPMSVLLDQSLRDHSPIVIGYSGWDGDILMSALHRRLSAGKLGTPAFWFCYARKSMEILPPWLTQSNDVEFVFPDDSGPAASARPTHQRPEPTAPVAPSPENAVGEGENSSDKVAVTLPADKVLDALVRQFGPELPPLLKNPLDFYADHLNRLLGRSDPEGETDAYYGFHKVIARVERARDSEAAEKPDALQRFREAMSKADYREAIKFANETDLNELSPKESADIVSALMDAARGLDDNSADEITAYDLAVRVVDGLARDGDIDPHLRRLAARALVGKAVVLRILARDEEAIAACNEVVRRFADATEPTLRELAAKALISKGLALRTLSKSEDAIAPNDEVVQRFGDAAEPALRVLAAKALFNKGQVLRTLNRMEEAIAAYDEAARRLAEATEPDLRELMGRALTNKGFTLWTLNRNEEAIAAYDEVINRFGDAAESALREKVAKALRNKGFALAILNRNEEAIAAYDEVVSRFADDAEPALREEAAKALRNKGQALQTLNRVDEAIAAYDEVARRFGDAAEAALREQVASALANKGFALEATNRGLATATYEELISRFDSAPESEIAPILESARQRIETLRGEDANGERTS